MVVGAAAPPPGADLVRPDPPAWLAPVRGDSPGLVPPVPAPRGRSSGGSSRTRSAVTSARVHHVPERLRAQGRLRGDLPRRHEAHCSGSADHRHHTRHPGAGGPPGRARPREHDRFHACRDPPRHRRPGRRRAETAARAAGRGGRAYVGPDNGLLLPAANRRASRRLTRLANPDYALDTISRTFHGRDPLQSCGRAPRVRGSPGSSARRSIRTVSSAWTCPSSSSATGHRRDPALR